MPGRLLGEAVVAQGRPVTDGGWVDKSHPDLELVEGQAPWDCSRECVDTPSQPDNPAGSSHVVQCLVQIPRRDPRRRGEFLGTFDREDTVSDLRKHASELGSHRAMY